MTSSAQTRRNPERTRHQTKKHRAKHKEQHRSTKEHKYLTEECGQTSSGIKLLDESTEYKDHPGITKANISERKGYHGLPVLVLLEREKLPRRAIWLPPSERAAVLHNNEHYIITNCAVLFASLCHANEVPLYVRYEDDPKVCPQSRPNTSVCTRIPVFVRLMKRR